MPRRKRASQKYNCRPENDAVDLVLRRDVVEVAVRRTNETAGAKKRSAFGMVRDYSDGGAA